MRPVNFRRVRRKATTGKDHSVFMKEAQKEPTFFGDSAEAAFFQPAAAVQRKCTSCEDEDKPAKPQGALQGSASPGHSHPGRGARQAHPRPPAVICDQGVVGNVRQEAHIRAQQAMFKLKGNHPTLGERQQRQAYFLARLTISRTLSLEQCTDIVEKMVNALSSNDKVQCGPEIDACSQWNAYVEGNRPPMHTCNKFFQLTHDDQVKTILHEAAHAVGIGNPQQEAYIFGFDCDNPTLGSFDTADSWAYFVLCASRTQ